MKYSRNCTRYIKAGEKIEKKLYQFIFLQLGNQEAASKILTQAFVECYRVYKRGLREELLERELFRTAFALCSNVYCGREKSANDSARAFEQRMRLEEFPPEKRAAIILKLVCRLEASDVAMILAPEHAAAKKCDE
ncbi:MAG: hypothetical protein GXY67_06015 [Clostridiales bacterium]|nr:hypothetical protein [Clostridiales bacterium]